MSTDEWEFTSDHDAFGTPMWSFRRGSEAIAIRADGMLDVLCADEAVAIDLGTSQMVADLGNQLLEVAHQMSERES